MTDDPRTASQVASELWTVALQSSTNPGDPLVVTDELLTVLEARLRRWIGAEGYAALLNRSVALTLPQHAALLRFSDLHVEPLPSLSLAPATTFSESETSDAVVALLVVMMEQLGRIVGADMAIRLVALSAPPSVRGLASQASNAVTS